MNFASNHQNMARIMFTDPKNLEKVVSLIILSILVFSKMATVGHFEKC